MDRISVEKLNRGEREVKGIDTWDIWEKEPSEFDWSYVDEEHCYIIEGLARIETADGTVEIKKGDYVVFPVGLKCKWKVIKRIKKYFRFE
ncbi:MAG: hypothetical protein AMS17_14155 [Spirochaetes bacterium DG_61]|nr:MAG: hypothetical protein AMS17_14155 [Spirochaetes bacterium DG_61]